MKLNYKNFLILINNDSVLEQYCVNIYQSHVYSFISHTILYILFKLNDI